MTMRLKKVLSVFLTVAIVSSLVLGYVITKNTETKADTTPSYEGEGTIYCEFTNIVNYKALTPGETYVFVKGQTSTYSGKDAIHNVPEGSAFLKVYKILDQLQDLTSLKECIDMMCRNLYVNSTEELKESSLWGVLTEPWASQYDFYIDTSSEEYKSYTDEDFINKCCAYLGWYEDVSAPTDIHTWDDYNECCYELEKSYWIGRAEYYYQKEAVTDEELFEYLIDTEICDKYEGYWGWECDKEDIQALVDVVEAGAGFDHCDGGTIGYVDANGKDYETYDDDGTWSDQPIAWWYSCWGGGVYYVGPFNLYSYKTYTYTGEDVIINWSGEPKTDGTVTKEDIIVSVKKDGIKNEVSDDEYVIEDTDPNGGIGISINQKVRVFNYTPLAKAETYDVSFDDDKLINGSEITPETSIASGAASYEAGESVRITAGDRAGYVFTGWTAVLGNGGDFNDLNLISGSAASETVTFDMPETTVTLTANYIPANEIVVDDATNGTVVADKNKSFSGDTITINVTPDSGYALKELKVYKDGDENTPVTFTNLGSGVYTFTMPSFGVRISAEFESHIHEGTKVDGKNATCTEDGWEDYYQCSCGSYFEDEACTSEILDLESWKTGDGKIEATGHDFSGEWTIIKEATETTEGKHETTCKHGCGVKKVETIPAIGSTEPDPTDGNLDKSVEVSQDAPIESAVLDNSKTSLYEAPGILTEEEKAEIQNGATAKIYLKIDNIDEATIPTENKDKIVAEAKNTFSGNLTIEFMDVSLYKQVGDRKAQAVSNPGTDIEVTLKLPDELLNVQKGQTRRFRIIKLHEGVTQTISGTLNYETNEFTFKTNEFSTYAIAYDDVDIKIQLGDGIVDGDNNLKVGGTLNLGVKVLPAEDANQKVSYLTSDASVATVDANGNVTAIGPGRCTITITSADGSLTKTITIIVAPASTTATGDSDAFIIYLMGFLALTSVIAGMVLTISMKRKKEGE